MSFPRYQEYKDSGVEWLGEVPEHWGVGSARWLTRRYSGGTPDKTKLEYWEEGSIPWLNSGAVNDRLITEPSTYITNEAFANSSAKWIPQGALVMALAGQGKTKGMVAQLGIPSTCNQSMAAIIPSSAINARFLFWWLDSNYQNIRNMAGGDLRDGLNLELLGNIQCPLPSPSEQTRISAFLDHETAKIDELVAEQRRLMALLKEKRQAVISHAVTQGLNPDAPMKPSGIEWLGDVPEHWEVRPLKHLARLQTGMTPPTDDLENYSDVEAFQWVRPEDLDETGAPTKATKFLTDMGWSKSRRIAAGASLICCIGTIGKVGISNDIVSTNQQITAAVSRQDSRYLYYSIFAGRSELELTSTGNVLRILNTERLGNIKFPAPHHVEQTKIATFLDRETAKLDILTTEAQHAIDLLQERRTALISAAVTGQIDVRGTVESL